MRENKEKAKYINIQLITTIFFIIALLLSFVIAYDKKQSLENKKRLFTNKEVQDLALLQTISVIIIAISFLYVNYEQYIISKKYNDTDLKELLLQIITSILSVIGALIGFYIVYTNRKNTLSIAEIESI